MLLTNVKNIINDETGQKMETIDIRKPTIYGNTIYMLMTGILEKNKFYKIMNDTAEDGKKRIVIEEAKLV